MIPYRIPGGHVGERLEIAHVPVGLYPEVLLPGCYRASRVGSNLVGIEITERILSGFLPLSVPIRGVICQQRSVVVNDGIRGSDARKLSERAIEVMAGNE